MSVLNMPHEFADRAVALLTASLRRSQYIEAVITVDEGHPNVVNECPLLIGQFENPRGSNVSGRGRR